MNERQKKELKVAVAWIVREMRHEGITDVKDDKYDDVVQRACRLFDLQPVQVSQLDAAVVKAAS